MIFWLFCFFFFFKSRFFSSSILFIDAISSSILVAVAFLVWSSLVWLHLLWFCFVCFGLLFFFYSVLWHFLVKLTVWLSCFGPPTFCLPPSPFLSPDELPTGDFVCELDLKYITMCSKKLLQTDNRYPFTHLICNNIQCLCVCVVYVREFCVNVFVCVRINFTCYYLYHHQHFAFILQNVFGEIVAEVFFFFLVLVRAWNWKEEVVNIIYGAD